VVDGKAREKDGCKCAEAKTCGGGARRSSDIPGKGTEEKAVAKMKGSRHRVVTCGKAGVDDVEDQRMRKQNNRMSSCWRSKCRGGNRRAMLQSS
jgi:hypothetical protein